MKIIGIAGPSSSGKSTVCKRLEQELMGVATLKLDDYYRNHDEFPQFGTWKNMDHPDCLDFNHLYQNLTKL